MTESKPKPSSTKLPTHITREHVRTLVANVGDALMVISALTEVIRGGAPDASSRGTRADCALENLGNLVTALYLDDPQRVKDLIDAFPAEDPRNPHVH